MATLKEIMADDIAAIFANTDEFAQAAKYNDADITVLAIDYGAAGAAGNIHADTAVIEVSVAEVPSPAYRDTLEINGTTWRVHRDEAKGMAVSGDGYTWKIPLIKDERPVRR